MSDVNEPRTTLFGIELLFKMNENLMKTEYDVMICFVHWVLTRFGFSCAGVGDDTTLPKKEELSELLPEGWNTETPYKLRYFYKNHLYILSGLVDGTEMYLNLTRPSDNRTIVAVINKTDIAATSGDYRNMIPNLEQLRLRIIKEMIESMLQVEVTKEATTQTKENRDIKRTPRSLHDIEIVTPPQVPRNPSVGVGVGVGSSDLFPPLIPGGGGGMLFQPPGMGPRMPFIDPSLPMGSVPPGARFDPIRPPNPFPQRTPSRDRHPDHDHMPPPGYDDMFM